VSCMWLCACVCVMCAHSTVREWRIMLPLLTEDANSHSPVSRWGSGDAAGAATGAGGRWGSGEAGATRARDREQRHVREWCQCVVVCDTECA
jgi:hypothetical protein